jgi:hypothetical protein
MTDMCDLYDVYVCMYACMHICMYVCICVCMTVHLSVHVRFLCIDLLGLDNVISLEVDMHVCVSGI